MELTLGQAQAQLDAMNPMMEGLLEMSETFIKSSGNFLPHGAMLDTSGEINYVAAAPENDITDATEVLPLLHDGLRTLSAKAGTQAVAVCESVLIGDDLAPAIKVLVEHRDGFCAALYLPFKTRVLRGPTYGDPLLLPADPEVGGW